MKLVARTEIPDKMDLTGGNIEVTEARMYLNNTSQGFVEGFKLEIDLKILAEVNGFPTTFESHVSHTFTDEEFVQFMRYLNVVEKTNNVVSAVL